WICVKGRILDVCFSMFGFLSCASISFWNAFLFSSFCLIFRNNFICFIDVFLPEFFLETLSFQYLTGLFMFILIHFEGLIMMVCPHFYLNFLIGNFIFIHRMINACFVSEHQYNRFIVSFSRIVTAW